MDNQTATSLETGLAAFRPSLSGKNRSQATIQAYATDLTQFFTYLRENDITVSSVADVARHHITDYLFHLAEERQLSGVSRARKLVAIRAFFRFLVDAELLARSPAATVEVPKKEQKARSRMRQDEYSRLLSIAGRHPRDFAILTILLQCGLRVTELCSLAMEDVDLTANVLTVRDGKGQADREIVVEKKAKKALTTYLKDRGEQLSPALFLNRYGEPLSRYGVHKLIQKYCQDAGIEKRVSAHIFRHTFASVKAEKGVSPYRLQAWLGHKDIKTTQIYVHMSKEYAKKAMEATSL
jgi:integrase/recombinase XerD